AAVSSGPPTPGPLEPRAAAWFRGFPTPVASHRPRRGVAPSHAAEPARHHNRVDPLLRSCSNCTSEVPAMTARLVPMRGTRLASDGRHRLAPPPPLQPTAVLDALDLLAVADLQLFCECPESAGCSK